MSRPEKSLMHTVLEEQVIDYLLERAEAKDRPMSFKDLMNFGG